jgi:hypothetical protein
VSNNSALSYCRKHTIEQVVGLTLMISAGTALLLGTETKGYSLRIMVMARMVLHSARMVLHSVKKPFQRFFDPEI